MYKYGHVHSCLFLMLWNLLTISFYDRNTGTFNRTEANVFGRTIKNVLFEHLTDSLVRFTIDVDMTKIM